MRFPAGWAAVTTRTTTTTTTTTSSAATATRGGADRPAPAPVAPLVIPVVRRIPGTVNGAAGRRTARRADALRLRRCPRHASWCGGDRRAVAADVDRAHR